MTPLVKPAPGVTISRATPRCSGCGICCGTAPGALLPSQLGTSDAEVEAGVAALLASGKWTITWYFEDGPRGRETRYFVRPARKGRERRRVDPDVMHPIDGMAVRCGLAPIIARECVFLGESGCTLAPEGRPAVCSNLKPGATNCIPTLTIDDVGAAWWPYRHMLLRLSKRPRARAMIAP